MPTPRPIRRLALAVTLLGALAACTGEAVPPPTAAPTTSTIGFSAVSSPPPSVQVGPDVDESVADRLVDDLETLQGEVQRLRGLRFLDPPRIEIVTAAELEARYGAVLDAGYDRAGLDLDTRVLRLLGLLGSGEDLRSLLADLSTEPAAALYDPLARAVVVDGSDAELGPVERASVVRELVHAVTDQYHRVGRRLQQFEGNGRSDEAAALAALFEADATYFQLVYLQGLAEEEQRAVAEASGTAPGNLPPVLAEQLTLSAERGLGFVEEMVRHGGTAQVDGAYGNGLTTEGILHPERVIAGERLRPLPDVTIALDGWRVVDQGSLGEMGLRSLLAEALPPDVLTQTADGWGADEALTLEGPGGELAWVYAFKGESDDDAVEVAQGFLDHAERVLGQANAMVARGGVEYADGTYLFVDREGDGLAVVVASDVEAGRQLAALAVIP